MNIHRRYRTHIQIIIQVAHSASRASITDDVEDQPTSPIKEVYCYISSRQEVHVVIDSYLLAPPQLQG